MSKLKDVKIPLLALIIPCYNEAEIIDYSSKIISEYISNLITNNLIDKNSFICFVDDGSKDNTFLRLISIKNKNNNIHIIKLSNNFGHQSALMAGLEYTKDFSDCVITMDADLQDDIEAIEQMVIKFNLGNEVVFGVRNNRDTDSIFKRKSAKLFYNVMSFLGTNSVKDHADYRLLSKRAIEFLLEYKEVNLFLRGVVTNIGLKSDIVYYKRGARKAGETKYPLNKMIGFAIEGITSFSTKPLRIVSTIGLIIIVLSILVGIYIFVSISSESTIRGWSSLIVSIWFLGGVQLICLGIIGEYIGKIYSESKKRPRYQIENIYNSSKK